MQKSNKYDVIILDAGAAGLSAAIMAAIGAPAYAGEISFWAPYL